MSSFFKPTTYSTQTNTQEQFSQELFTTQDLIKTQYSQKFFQSQIPCSQSQLQDENNFHSDSHESSSGSGGIFSDESDIEMVENSQEQSNSSESENAFNSSDDALFQEPSQFTQTFNYFSKPSQSQITTQQSFIPQSQNLVSQATTTHSRLTIDFNLNESIDRKVPQSIVNLYTEIKGHYSDWTFISILSGQLCTDKFPMGSYNNLKLALLLSLATSSESPLHIMAIGSEMSNANMIMRELGELAERFVPVTNKTADGIVIKKNGTCEAGSLVMATHGISFIGYWEQLKPKIKTQLFREIETNTLLVQKAQKYIGLESAVWAHWNYAKKIKKDIAAVDQFMNVFGIPIIIDDQVNRDSIVNDLIDQLSVSPPGRFEGFDIPKEDMRLFIAIIKEQSVTFEPQAEVMLKNYLTATKTIRKNVLTQKGIEMLRKMSEAHAKLCLRSNVMRQDVLAAIGICERFIKTLFDTDAYSSPNETKVNSIEDIDAFQSKLFEWFSRFTKDILEKI